MHYTIYKEQAADDNTTYVVGHSLGGGYTRHIVELGDGDTSSNPSSTKGPIYGSNPPSLVVYDCHKTGIRVVIYDSAKDFYESLFVSPPKEAMQAVVDYCWEDEAKSYEENPCGGHVFEHLKVIAFWLAGNK